jgi:hypothetical protein
MTEANASGVGWHRNPAHDTDAFGGAWFFYFGAKSVACLFVEGNIRDRTEIGVLHGTGQGLVLRLYLTVSKTVDLLSTREGIHDRTQTPVLQGMWKGLVRFTRQDLAVYNTYASSCSHPKQN